MIEYNYLTQKGLLVRRYDDSNLFVEPASKVDPETLDFIKKNKQILLDQVDSISSAYPDHGVGAEIARIIPAWFSKDGCGCADYARKLDGRGLKWCEDNRDAITGRLASKGKEFLIGGISEKLTEIAARRIVDTAINRTTAANSKKIKDSIGDWFVGVTTAPRTGPTLHECIQTVRAAGWNPVVFAEPGSPATNAGTVWNDKQLGVWHNWLSMAKYALTTDAKYILTLQDDIILHPDTRNYVESMASSIEGFLSLYTSRKYGRNQPGGIRRVFTKSLWGACALAFPRDVLQAVVDHEISKTWLGARPKTKSTRAQTYQGRAENPHRIANSDTAIGKAMNALSLPMEFVIPSPGRHIALHSSISHGGNTGQRNCDPCADFARPLADQAKVETE